MCRHLDLKRSDLLKLNEQQQAALLAMEELDAGTAGIKGDERFVRLAAGVAVVVKRGAQRRRCEAIVGALRSDQARVKGNAHRRVADVDESERDRHLSADDRGELRRAGCLGEEPHPPHFTNHAQDNI
jgi:hypothetical protein